MTITGIGLLILVCGCSLERGSTPNETASAWTSSVQADVYPDMLPPTP